MTESLKHLLLQAFYKTSRKHHLVLLNVRVFHIFVMNFYLLQQ